jgi:hypothetical protein
VSMVDRLIQAEDDAAAVRVLHSHVPPSVRVCMCVCLRVCVCVCARGEPSIAVRLLLCSCPCCVGVPFTTRCDRSVGERCAGWTYGCQE